MKKKGYKGRCEKRSLSKCVGICRTYDHIQSAYADRLEADEQVKEFQCNVLLEGLSIGEYTTDFLPRIFSARCRMALYEYGNVFQETI